MSASTKLDELRKWLLATGEDDIWWFSIGDTPMDGVFTLSEIEDHLQRADLSDCYALHSSQFESSTHKWVNLKSHSDDLGGQTQNEPSQNFVASFSDLQNESRRVSTARVLFRRLTGSLILLVPLITSLVIYMKYGGIELNSENTPGLFFTLALMIAATSILVWIDASLAEVAVDARRKRNGTPPAEWATLTAILWFIGFPAYCARRLTIDRENGLIASLAVIAAIFFSISTINISVNDHLAFIDYVKSYRSKSTPKSVDEPSSAEVSTPLSSPSANEPTGVLGNLTASERSALSGSAEVSTPLSSPSANEPTGVLGNLANTLGSALPTSPLTGPKIIGVQLGMNLDEVIKIFSDELQGMKFSSADEQFENCATSVEGEFVKEGAKSEGEAALGFVAALMGAYKGTSVKLGANEKGELSYVEIGGKIVDILFETESMSDERFIQMFVDSYGIPSMSPNLGEVSGFSGGNFGTAGLQTTWTHESDSGFVLKIYGPASSENSAFDTAKSTRTIELYKVKSAKEAKSRFR
jgi:hypothetical protein